MEVNLPAGAPPVSLPRLLDGIFRRLRLDFRYPSDSLFQGEAFISQAFHPESAREGPLLCALRIASTPRAGETECLHRVLTIGNLAQGFSQVITHRRGERRVIRQRLRQNRE